MDTSRRSLFEEVEKGVLKPLPTERYPSKTIKVLTVQINYHVELREDRPPEHRYIAEWSSERFLRWAGAIGADVALVIGKVLERRKYPEQAFKVCMGILSLGKRYDPERLNKACRSTMETGV